MFLVFRWFKSYTP